MSVTNDQHWDCNARRVIALLILAVNVGGTAAAQEPRGDVGSLRPIEEARLCRDSDGAAATACASRPGRRSDRAANACRSRDR